MRITRQHLAKIIREEVANLSESEGASSYKERLQSIYDEIVSKIEAGELTTSDLGGLDLGDNTRRRIRSAAQKYRMSQRTPEQKAASAAKAKKTRDLTRAWDQDRKERDAIQRADAARRREQGFLPNTLSADHGDKIPNPAYYDRDGFDPRSGFETFRLKPEYSGEIGDPWVAKPKSRRGQR